MTATVLYRNQQWMVQDEPRGQFLVEINPHNPDDMEGLYWFPAQDLVRVHRRWISHVCEKTWVDIDAFEQAVHQAIKLFGLRPNYDVATAFAEARRLKEAAERLSRPRSGLRRPSEFTDEVISLFWDEAN